VTVRVLALYVAASLLLYGRGVVFGDARETVVGRFGSDQGFFMWSLVYWKRVLSGAEVPFLTDLIFSPDGFNLAWATVIPLPAVLAAPLTATVGPELAYNVLALAAPPLAAWCCFLLCREACGRVGPALAGGAVFGFSSYMSAEMQNHLNLALVFPLPLAAYLVLRHARGTIGDRRFAVAIGAVLVAQFLIFTEMLLGLVLFGGLAGVLALILAGPDLRPALRRTARLTLIGGVGALVVVSPYLYEAFAHTNPIAERLSPGVYVLDLANLVVPTEVTEIGGHQLIGTSATFTGNVTEQLGYLPLPLLGLAVAFAIAARGTFAGRLLPIVALVAVVCALGPRLVVAGAVGPPLPWALAQELPLLDLALPTRFVVHAWLALAVMIALVLAMPARLGVARSAVALLGIVMLVPNLDAGFWWHRLAPPAFFANGAAEATLGPDPVVLLLPHGFLANGMYWQAKTDMAFRQAGGYASSVIPTWYSSERILPQLYDVTRPPSDSDGLRRLLQAKRVTHVVVDGRFAVTYAGLLRAAGLTGRPVDGVVVYDVG
jgi:hypothetical protein